MHINDRSNIARAQLMLWNIDEQHDLRKPFYHLLVPFEATSSQTQFAQVDCLAAAGADGDERQRRVEQFFQAVEVVARGFG